MVTSKGKFTIVAIADSYEKVIRKVVRDLESVWNHIVDLPYSLYVEETDETEIGAKVYDAEGNEIDGNEVKQMLDKWRIVSNH